MSYRYLHLVLYFLSAFILAQNKCDIYAWNQSTNTYLLEAKEKNYTSYLDSLNRAGYHALTIDSMRYVVAQCKLYVNKGNLYKDYILNHEDYLTLDKVKDSLLKQGQVFSKITLYPKTFKNDTVVYDIKIEEEVKNRKIDDIIFVGYSKIPKGFKHSLLEKTKLANAETIKNIEETLKSNKAITLSQPSKISYTRDSTFLYVYTQKQKQNHFDGIIGFGTNENNQLKLNGHVQLNLINALNKLEEINLQWLGSENKSQNLDLGLKFPYVLLNAIGLQSNLHIHKQDSTYLQLRWDNGVTYQINASSYILGSFNFETSNYINHKNNTTNTDDYHKTGFGVGYVYQNNHILHLDTNKWGLSIQNNFLKKNIKGNKSTQTEILYTLYRQQRIWKNHYLYGQLKGENLIQKEDAFLLNEMYQLGGMNNLRGFNQNSIFTPSYHMLTLSYRYIPNNSFLIETFSDFALKENIENHDLDYLFGVGTGVQFRVKFGLFKLMYAVGKEKNSSFDLSNGKVHFGITTIF